ncbi:DUF6913 domain-containing protein [Thalassobellus citreus]|uniref:DUF6913 domain-containing protein n=1 Tax=Thalassobellus citreus TaxID=3367752 RepID=UPI0037942C98
MIFKGFKEKSNKKYLNKLLSKRQLSFVDNKIDSLGIILNIDETDDFEKLRNLADCLKVRPNKLKIIAFSSSKTNDLYTWTACFNYNDFGWKGVIKNVELQSFLEKEFDALISFYDEDVLELKMLTAMSKAKFKIGVLQTDERLNDLIIKTKIKEFKVFKKELFKYLTILNKIKNE